MSSRLQSGIAVIAHSGGPTPVINASLLGAVEEARQHPEITRLYGARFGLSGVLNGDFIDLFAQPDELMERVGRSPASALGCSRREVSAEDISALADILRAQGVQYFFYTGGNGSMGTAMQLHEAAQKKNYALQVIGIPKTIDNDLHQTDHTPGYASTARFFAHAVRDIGADNLSLPNQVEVVEILGRNVGWLAAATTLARTAPEDAPHLVYLPEKSLPLDKLLDDVSAVFRRLGRCLVAVCEGQLDEHGEPFGADVRSGSRGSLAQNLAHRLSLLISSKLNIRARSEKPGLLGRATSAYVSPTDWEEARLCGMRAVSAAVQGLSDVMITMKRNAGPDYSVGWGEAPLHEVAFKERTFPLEWISADGTDVLLPFHDYAAPLVGEIKALAHLSTDRPR